MNTKKITKRALFTSALALMLCVSMLVGSTFAWFTDSVTSAGNVIKAGTLNIDLGIKTSSDADYVFVKADNAATKRAFDYDLWEPGYTEWVNARVVTKGNLALKYTMRIVPNGAVSILADVIDVYYAPSEIAKPASRPADLTSLGLVRVGTLRDVIDDANLYINDTLIPNNTLYTGAAVTDSDDATLVLHMREEAGNEYQGLSIGSDFSLQILATQYTYENDSFDNQYDLNADETPDNTPWPITISSEFVSDPAAPLTIVAGTTTVVVPANASNAAGDSYELVVENTETILDESTGNTVANLEISLEKNGTPIETEVGVLYQVSIDLSDVATSVSAVTHNGNPVTPFTFENGILSFTTDSFSPFAVTYLDKDSVIYKYDAEKSALENGRALADLIESTNAKNVFVESGNYEINRQVWLHATSRNIIGIGNNVNIKSVDSYNGHVFLLGNENNVPGFAVTVKNLKIDGNKSAERGGNSPKGGIYIRGSANVTIENVTVANTNWGNIQMDTSDPNCSATVNAKNVAAQTVSLGARTSDSEKVANFNFDDACTFGQIQYQFGTVYVNGELFTSSINYASNSDELNAAIAGGAKLVYLTNSTDTYTLSGTPRPEILNGVRLIGPKASPAKVTIATSSESYSSHYLRGTEANTFENIYFVDADMLYSNGGTFKNCEFAGLIGYSFTGANFENCVFHKYDGTNALHFAESTQVTVKGGTIDGTVEYGASEVTFDSVTINGDVKSWAPDTYIYDCTISGSLIEEDTNAKIWSIASDNNGLSIAHSADDSEVILLGIDEDSTATEIVVPAGVTEVAACAFKGNDTIETLTLPSSIQTIGAQAFADMENLSSMTISGDVSVDAYAFYHSTYEHATNTSVTITYDGGATLNGQVFFTNYSNSSGGKLVFNDDVTFVNDAGHPNFVFANIDVIEFRQSGVVTMDGNVFYGTTATLKFYDLPGEGSQITDPGTDNESNIHVEVSDLAAWTAAGYPTTFNGHLVTEISD